MSFSSKAIIPTSLPKLAVRCLNPELVWQPQGSKSSPMSTEWAKTNCSHCPMCLLPLCRRLLAAWLQRNTVWGRPSAGEDSKVWTQPSTWNLCVKWTDAWALGCGVSGRRKEKAPQLAGCSQPHRALSRCPWPQFSGTMPGARSEERTWNFKISMLIWSNPHIDISHGVQVTNINRCSHLSWGSCSSNFGRFQQQGTEIEWWLEGA